MKVLAHLHRVFVSLEKSAEVVAFYEALLGQEVSTRFRHPAGLELAVVGPMLVIAGEEAALAPFRATSATFLVDSLAGLPERLLALGAEVLDPVRQVPTGWNLRARHPDGLVVEYVEHRAAEAPPCPGARS